VRGSLEQGARVVATDHSWAPSGVSGDEVAFLPELAARPDVLADVMDITIDSHVRRVYQAAMQRFGTIDVIVSNAGLRQRDLDPPHGSVSTLETEVGDWQRMFDTHVFGSLRVITGRPARRELPRGAAAGCGHPAATAVRTQAAGIAAPGDGRPGAAGHRPGL
jgi:NAD(P)-dependent dehydrogenase (short-subunit alcohol dehydrogenase family)